jgi:hypothetical protein
VQRTLAVEAARDSGTQRKCVNGSMHVQPPRLAGAMCALINAMLHALSASNQDAVAATGGWTGT